MIRRTSLSALILTVFAALMALTLLAAPALAGPGGNGGGRGNSKNKSGSASDRDGDADSDSSTAYTEDNDSNDGGTPNNVPDEGDNAHPSGKDRSVEHGGSGNQGKSESNPDDSKGPMRYEGELGDDKPNGPGGTDLADQDGNNGCGNDDDFDDDNNGWCGKPTDNPTDNPTPTEEPCDSDETMPGTQPCEETPPPCDADATMPGNQACGDDDDVLGGVITSPPDDDVLGGQLTRPGVNAAPPAIAPARDTRGAVLPFTGAGSAIAYLLIGLGLVVLGGTSMVVAKN